MFLQVREELEALACLATTNAMYIVKGEKHVFTNNGSYTTILDKMKAHVKQEANHQKACKASCNRSTLGRLRASEDEFCLRTREVRSVSHIQFESSSRLCCHASWCPCCTDWMLATYHCSGSSLPCACPKTDTWLVSELRTQDTHPMHYKNALPEGIDP